MCVENANLRFPKDKDIWNSRSLPSFHSCFIYVHLHLSPCLFLSVCHMYNYPHLFSASWLRVSSFPRVMDSSYPHLDPPLFTARCPAFCLSKGRLLVPYQTLMHYEHALSSGLDRNTSHCLPATLLKQPRRESYCNPARSTLFSWLLGWII